MKKSVVDVLIMFLCFLSILGYIIIETILIVMLLNKKLDIPNFILFTISLTTNLILLYGLNSALERITNLEQSLVKRKVIKPKDISMQEEKDFEKVELCKTCGYQLFKEDKECPMCHTKRIIKK